MIDVKFKYESQITKIYSCEEKSKIGDICKKFTFDIGINFNYICFLSNGKQINNSDYNKPISDFINKYNQERKLVILANKLGLDDNISVIFHFKSHKLTIQSKKVDKMTNIFQQFANKINQDINSLKFYRKKLINHQETLEEIIFQDDDELNTINIFVEENKNESNSEKKLLNGISFYLICFAFLLIAFYIGKNILFFSEDDCNSKIKKETNSNKTKEKTIIKNNCNERCLSCNNSVLKKRKKKEKEKNIIYTSYCNENCLDCGISSSKRQECVKCKEDFDLYEGKCIVYTFSATFDVHFINEKIKIYNNDSYHRSNLYAIKVDNKIISPTTEYNFNSKNQQLVYFYFYENTSISLNNMFYNITRLIYFSFNKNYINNFTIINMNSMFNKCISLKKMFFGSFKGNKVTDISYLFSDCISLTSIKIGNFNSSLVTSMKYLFNNCSSLKYIDLSHLNTNKVTDMSRMLAHCNSLNSLNIHNFKTQNVINMKGMFYNCSSLTSLDLINFNTHNVEKMNYMFYNCKSLVSLNLQNFNTINVVDMDFMFSNCISLISLNIKNFNTENVESMAYMFYNCSSLISLDLSNFNITKVNNINSLLYLCDSLIYIDISGFIYNNILDIFNRLPNNCTVKMNIKEKEKNKISTIPSSCNITYKYD